MGDSDAAFDAALSGATAGDEDSFAALWRIANPRLLRYLWVTVGIGADDIASETWLKAIPAIPRFRGTQRAFNAWLITIARNHQLDQRRRQVRRPETVVADIEHLQVETAADAADIALERISLDVALRLVARLPSEQAEMVALRVIVGLDMANIAQIVGRTPGAVRVAIHRGLKKLAELLDDPCDNAQEVLSDA